MSLHMSYVTVSRISLGIWVFSELTIAALIGHKGRTVTSRYVHSADAVLLAAADAVANKTLALMGESAPEAQVIPLRA